MTDSEYNEIQKRFKNKIILYPTNKEEEYNNGIRSCMSIIHEIYKKQKEIEPNDDNIKQLPSIQHEIVRCKDCKHWIPYDWMFSEVWRSKNMADYPEDEIGCNWCDMAMKANDFCSRGEKREVMEWR